MNLYQFLRSNKSSVFTIIYLLVAPLIFDALLISFAINKNEWLIQFSLLQWVFFYCVCAFTMALGLTHTTIIALLSGFYLSWKSVPFVLISYLIASIAGYVIGLRINKGELINTIQKSPKVLKIKEELQRKELNIILLTRISPILPFAITNFLFAALKTNIKNYFWASLFGMLPRTLLCIWIGSEASTLLDALNNPSSFSYSKILTTILLIVSVGGLFYYINQAIKRSSQH